VTIAPEQDAFLTGLERQLFGGPAWRRKPYPRPGDLYRLLNPHGVDTPALRLIDEHLLAVDRGEITRLAISVGPQEGKSERVSRTFPLWSLLGNPEKRIILASYQDEIAHRWGRSVRTDILTHNGAEGAADLGLRLRGDSKAVDRWQLDGHAGGMVTAGLRGAITGRPADLMIIDDPYKDKADARSRLSREAVKDFWRAVVVPRMAPAAPIVVVHTRWHEDDLIGWLLKEHGDLWEYLNIPARSEGGDDPLGRPKGRWLTSARGRTVADWEKTRREVGEADFNAIYQGHPNPLVGGLFPRKVWRYWQATADPWVLRLGYTDPASGLPNRRVDVRQGFRFATVDFAASERTSADWTVCAVWCMAASGELVLLDLVRVQERPEGHWDVIRPAVEKWDAKLYVEASQWSTDMVYTAGREGFPLDKVTPDKDKYTRAVPAARRAALHPGIFLPARATWLGEFVEELAEFPNARHDDQVDVVAYAHRVVSENWLADPGQTEQSTEPAPGPSREAAVLGAGDFDPETVDF
jgi:predicted phage terminase large subunit-like protein